jgi:hypothetical protein
MAGKQISTLGQQRDEGLSMGQREREGEREERALVG